MTERGAILLAGAAHLALLAGLSLTWAMQQPLPPSFAEAVPVEIVEISDVPRITEPPKPSIDAAPQEMVEATAPEPAPDEKAAADPTPKPDTPPPTALPTPDAKPAAEPPKPAVKPKDEAATKAKKKAAERLDAQELANLIDKSLPKAKTKTRDPSDFASAIEKSLPKGAQIDARMTATLVQAARAQIAPCWNPPLGGADVAKMTVVLEFALTRAGEVVAPPEVARQTGMTAGNHAYARAFADAAKRAVMRCAPIKLPPEYYDVWKDFELTFDQSGMT